MFYTYLWLREDGTPYYVGKGKDDRAFTSSSHSVHRPPDISRIILQEFESEVDAYTAEIFFILYYGRLDSGTGCLRNLTDGGENPPSPKGKKLSQTTKKRISEGNKGKPKSVEHVRKNRESHIGLKYSEERKRKIGDSHRWSHRSEETRSNMRSHHKGMSGRKHSEETKNKMREAKLGKAGRVWTEEQRIAFSNLKKGKPFPTRKEIA